MASVHSNIWKYGLFKILSNFWFTIAIWILFIQAFNINYTQIGMLEAVGLIVIILLELPSGIFSDMFGHKLTLFLATLMWSIGSFVVGFGNGFYMFLAGYSIIGIAEALQSGSEEALFYESLKKLRRQKDYLKIKSRIRFAMTFTIIIGAVVGSYLFNINIRLPMILNAVLILCSAIVVAGMVEPYARKKVGSLKKHFVHFKEALHFSMTHSHVKWFIVYGAIIILPMGLFVNLLSQPYLVKIGFSILGIGTVFAVIHGISGIVASFADKIERKIGERISMFLIVAVQGITFLIMAWINAPIAAIAVIMLYISRDYSWMILDNYLHYHIKSKNRATVLSIKQFTIDSFAAVFVVFGGYLTDVFDINTTLLMLGLLTLMLGIPHFLKRYKYFKRGELNESLVKSSKDARRKQK